MFTEFLKFDLRFQWRTPLLWIGIAVFALLAGLAVAGALGARKPGESATGGISVQQSPSQRANECIPKIQSDAQAALDMGLVNKVVPLAELETETLQWCREMLQHSPMALRCLKACLNADCDGQMGLLDLAGNATLLYYMSEEAQEGKKAFVEKRKPDFSKFPRYP